MKAITVEPKKPGIAKFEEIAEPDVREGDVLVEAIAVGVCGTDVEIAEGKYGWAPPEQSRLVLGHESLGRVIDPGPKSGLKKGDLVVSGGIQSRLSVADVGSMLVLKNIALVGSVNANKRHWYKAGESLARADRPWLAKLITRSESPDNFQKAFDRKPDDIKVVIQFSAV